MQRRSARVAAMRCRVQVRDSGLPESADRLRDWHLREFVNLVRRSASMMTFWRPRSASCFCVAPMTAGGRAVPEVTAKLAAR
jgi:hypothetical protein